MVDGDVAYWLRALAVLAQSQVPSNSVSNGRFTLPSFKGSDIVVRSLLASAHGVHAENQAYTHTHKKQNKS